MKYCMVPWLRQLSLHQHKIVQLDKAIASITIGDRSYGAADLYFGGDLTKWKKYANSLKLQIGLRIKNANPTLAQKVITEAMTSPLISSNAETAARTLSVSATSRPAYTSTWGTVFTEFAVGATISVNLASLRFHYGTD